MMSKPTFIGLSGRRAWPVRFDRFPAMATLSTSDWALVAGDIAGCYLVFCPDLGGDAFFWLVLQKVPFSIAAGPRWVVSCHAQLVGQAPDPDNARATAKTGERPEWHAEFEGTSRPDAQGVLSVLVRTMMLGGWSPSSACAAYWRRGTIVAAGRYAMGDPSAPLSLTQ